MIALALLLQASIPIAPVKASPQGQDMIELFGSLCVEAGLNSAKAHQLDNQPAIARPMTSDEMLRTMPGGVITEGWIANTRHGGWAALWFAPTKRTCGITVRAAEPAGMATALNTRLQGFFGSLGAPVMRRPDETVIESGVVVHRASWTITAGTHELAVIASFGDKPIGAHQHLMTFTMMH